MAVEMTWQTMHERAARQGLLGRQFYVVRSSPTNGLDPIADNLTEHVAYQKRLEAEGVMFAAGPLATPDEKQWLGEGMFIYQAASLAEATAYADADPMHASGAREYQIRTWLMNEGTAR